MKTFLIVTCLILHNIQATRPLLQRLRQPTNGEVQHITYARRRRLSKSSKSSKAYKGKGKGKGGEPTLAEFVRDSPDLSTLKKAFMAAGSLYRLDGGVYTLLAPNNDAFEALFEAYPAFADVLFTKPWNLHLSDLLFTHVIEGSAVLSKDLNDEDTIDTCSGEEIAVVKGDDRLCFTPSLEDEACVEIADFVACNGVAHILDGVIFPIWLFFSIYEAVEAVLPTLATLIECAGLDVFLTEEIGLTLFAPSEEALADLDVDALCADPETLTEILSYHVVPTVLPSTQIPIGKSYVKSTQGSFISLYFSKKPGTDASFLVDHATVVSLDVGANNGMIHVIDSVLTIPVFSKGKGSAKAKGTGKGMHKGKSSKSRR